MGKPRGDVEVLACSGFVTDAPPIPQVLGALSPARPDSFKRIGA